MIVIFDIFKLTIVFNIYTISHLGLYYGYTYSIESCEWHIGR